MTKGQLFVRELGGQSLGMQPGVSIHIHKTFSSVRWGCMGKRRQAIGWGPGLGNILA